MRHTTDPESGRHAPGLLLHSAGFYDLTLWLLNLGRGRDFHEQFLELADLKPGETVLDVGCGTGSLALVAKRAVGPEGAVFGVDASPEMLARAMKKARRAGLEVVFDQAPAQDLPYRDAEFDAVFSTLMLHHLPHSSRGECAGEIARVLKPGGRVLAVDFGAPAGRRGGLHRHGGLSLDEMIALFRGADLHVEDSGETGIAGMQFLLATRPAFRANHPQAGDEITLF
ncbi:MAG TPA: class I SAM-dependent methyltransferase [Gammaproteobacteria bacterium]|nr:class I SAM-dependent methyltransferase [Gammaproteobacteria bacterium]